MAEVHGSESRLFMNGLDLTAMFRELEGGSEHDMVDTTAFSDTSDSHIVAPMVKRSMSANGMIDVDPSTGAHASLQALHNAAASLTAGQVVVWQMRDTTLGDPGLVIVGSLPKPTLKNVLRDVVQAMFSAQSNVSGWCRALKNKGALVAAGNGAALDNAAATTRGGVSVLQVMALTGTTPTLTVKTQHSVDGSTWVDLCTHTLITAAGVTAGYADVQQLAATATVNRYLRHTLAVTSGSLTSVTLAHQFVRNP
ncbi:MAG: hypothetical protein JWL76_2138 [Thermoleophilia bacterium]|nr:hypothetical protein [Thermoleophilia bacterium]